MLRALHFRVLIRQWGKNAALDFIAKDFARSCWAAARQLDTIISQLRRGSAESTDDDLPEHLALLLDQDCDDVLNDNIVQRAHNLAWNRPTMHNVAADVDGMNTVVEDPAVRSPMDAVAAWWSSLVLQRTLIASLSAGLAEAEETPETADRVRDDLDLATMVAPIGSNAQLRALAARAVLVSDKRGSHIALALQALNPSLNPDKHPQYSKVLPPLIDTPLSPITPDPDVQMALRCAMGIAHLQRFVVPPQDALAEINRIAPGPEAPRGVSLLACTAVFKLVDHLHSHAVAAEACSTTLERLAGTLRIWVGSSGGDDCGLDQDMRRAVVDRCLVVAKSVVGMDSDTGYGSMSDCVALSGDEGGC